MDPPKARIAELLSAIQERLSGCGVSGLLEVVELARTAAADAGLPDARITSDAKHVEIGLTDKSDSARWLLRDLWARGIGPALVLIIGDEMGPVGSRNTIAGLRPATVVRSETMPRRDPLSPLSLPAPRPQLVPVGWARRR